MRNKFLLNFERLIYGNNFSIDKILKLFTVVSIYAIIQSFIYHQAYFSVLGVNFQSYSEPSDYVPIFFSKIHVLLIYFIVINLIYLLAINSDKKYHDELEVEGKYFELEKAKRRFNLSLNIPVIFYCLFMIFGTVKQLIENDWIFLKTIFWEELIMILVLIVFILLIKKIIKSRNFSILFFVVTGILLALSIGYIKGEKAKINIVESSNYEFILEGDTIYIDNQNLFLVGETSKYFFTKKAIVKIL